MVVIQTRPIKTTRSSHHQSLSSGTSSNGATSHRGCVSHQDHFIHRSHDGQDDEFICVIRPADASFPHIGGSHMFSSLLSTASMVAYDLELMNSGRERGETGNVGDDNHHHRRGGPSSVGSSGSHNSSGEEASVKPRSDISKGWLS